MVVSLKESKYALPAAIAASRVGRSAAGTGLQSSAVVAARKAVASK
jgi:hypothetical protein